MSKVKMISPAVPNVPWQDKPEGHTGAPVWRYSENPIIGRNPVEGVARIFNSAVMPYGDEFIGVFRGEQVNGIPYIYLGRSKDAIHWDFDKNKIQFVDEEGKPFMPIYAYDPRLVKVEDTYYIIWCQDFYGAAIGIAKTTDFKTFVRIENPFLAALKGLILDFDAGIAVVADVGQRRYVAAPVHIAQAGQLGAHVVQRIGHGAHLAQLLGEELDILVMDMENLVLKFVDGLDIVHHLPYEVRGIVIDAQVGRRQPLEYLAPDCRGGHQVLTAGPLVRTKEHGAVFNGDADPQLLRKSHDAGPHQRDLAQIVLHA